MRDNNQPLKNLLFIEGHLTFQISIVRTHRFYTFLLAEISHKEKYFQEKILFLSVNIMGHSQVKFQAIEIPRYQNFLIQPVGTYQIYFIKYFQLYIPS